MNEKEFIVQREILLRGRGFTFRPLVYKQYKQFLSTIPKILSQIAKAKPDLFDGVERSEKEILKELPSLLHETGPAVLDRVLELIAWSLKDEKGRTVTESWLSDNLLMIDFSKLLSIFFEVNDVGGMIRNFRRIGSAMGKISLPKPISSSNSGETTPGRTPTISTTS